MKLKLSKRLLTIVNMCEPCDTIIDVGTDHGKVPIAIANLNIAKNIIASDIKEEPLEFCKLNAKEYLEDKHSNFSIICADGLGSLDKSIESGIIITGMGYDAIVKILDNICEYNFKYLIVSPHTKIADFVRFVQINNLYISEEKTIFEDDKAYFIFKILKFSKN